MSDSGSVTTSKVSACCIHHHHPASNELVFTTDSFKMVADVNPGQSAPCPKTLRLVASKTVLPVSGGKQGHTACVWGQARPYCLCLGASKAILPVSGGKQGRTACVWGQARPYCLCLGASKAVLPVSGVKQGRTAFCSYKSSPMTNFIDSILKITA